MFKGLLQLFTRPAARSLESPVEASTGVAGTNRSIRWGGLWSSLPPLFLLAMVWGLPRSQAPQPLALDRPDGASIKTVLPSSATLVVTPRKAASDVLLRGRLEPTVSVTGQAPISGRVLRVRVQPGEKVAVGDTVIDLSPSGGLPALNRATRAERAQNSAESAQIEAVGQQAALQKRIRDATRRLAAARARVAAAQSQVAQARAVVRRVVQRLQQSENEPDSGAPVPAKSRTNRESAIVTARRSEDAGVRHDAAPVNPRLMAERRAALRAAQRDLKQTQQLAEDATAKAIEARRISEGIARAAHGKEDKLREARAVVEKLQGELKAGTVEVAAVETAQAEVSQAEQEVKDANAKLIKARGAADKAELAAERLRVAANRASGRVARANQTLQQSGALAASAAATPSIARSRPETTDEKPRLTRRDETGGNGGNTDGDQTSVEQAVESHRAAVEISEKTIAEARRVRDEIEDYERQVRSTTRRLNTTSSRLESAQMRVIDDTIQTKLSSVRAPASGVVLEVATDGEEVSPGEAVIKIGRANLLQARFADYTDAWKTLKPDMLLPATVQTTQGQQDTQGKAVAPDMQVHARVRSVTPPAAPGAAAIVDTVIFNPPDPGSGAQRRFRAGMTVMCSIARPSSHHVFLVPTSAVLEGGDGKHYVAVLTPVAEAATPDQKDTAVMADESSHHIEWRPVTVGASNGVQQQIVNGLLPGERIALQPTALQTLMRSSDGAMTVRLAAAL